MTMLGSQQSNPNPRAFEKGWWNQERVEQLKQLWKEGVSASGIANILGCTRNAVIGKSHRLGLATRAPKPRSLEPNPKPYVHRKPRPKIVMALPDFKPEPLPPLIEEIRTDGVRLMDLENRHCRYLLSSSNDGNHLYCGRIKAYQSYCDEHARLCFNPDFFRRNHY